MFGLAAGKFAISIAPWERGPYIGHFAQPCIWFGEAAALTEQPRRIGLSATRCSEVLHLPLHAIPEIIAAGPGAWRWFGLAAIAHNDTAIGGVDDLLIRGHVKRFVAVLRASAAVDTPRGPTARRSRSASTRQCSSR
jgi:hypothetical protein